MIPRSAKSFVCVAFIAALASCSAGVENKAREALSGELKDGGSAEFRNLNELSADNSGNTMICGEVNAKNSFGGYTGFVPFIAVVPNGDVIIGTDDVSAYAVNEVRRRKGC